MTNKDKIEILESVNETLAADIVKRDDLPENTRKYFNDLILQNNKEIKTLEELIKWEAANK